MSTCNEYLQETVSDVLTAMRSEHTRLASAGRAAAHSLYYAQGAKATALDKLEKNAAENGFAKRLDEQGLENDNLADSVHGSAKQVQAAVATSVTNTATAARNIQNAAAAVAQLASDIGAAYNIVAAEDHSTEIYNMTAKANQLVRGTAYHAEEVAKIAMEATTKTSEIMATPLLTQVATAKAGLEKLLTVTEAEFARLAKERTAFTNKANAASKAEKASEGVFKDRQVEHRAIENASTLTMQALNFDLSVTVESASDVRLSCLPFEQPFPAEGDTVSNRIPGADPHTYGIVVPAVKAGLFNIEKAELLFTEHKKDRFFVVRPNNKGRPGSSEPPGDTYSLTVDSDGQPVYAGKPYVIFLYIELSQAYKKFTNNFMDLISSASDPFVLATTLSSAEQIGTTAPAMGEPASESSSAIYFKVPGAMVMGAEYRCLLLPLNPSGSENFLTAEDGVDSDGKAQKGRLSFFFNLTVAEHIPPASYALGKIFSQSESLVQDVIHPAVFYEVRMHSDSTDCFGTPLVAGKGYVPVILSVVPENTNSGQYIGVLSDITAAPTLVFSDNYEVRVSNVNRNGD